ncbi:MAG: alpha/beta fold hydrolase [Candidatus Gastranaerophilales bacterium]|nr:alpha/beta fold hydrolase [Candidatus Gastranaerophilales bacterium]
MNTITTGNTSSYQYNNQSFTARPKPYNAINPVAKYLRNYMNNSAKASRNNLEPVIPELVGKIKTVTMKSSGGKTISAWDINPEKSENYVLFLHGMAQNVTNYQPLYKKLLAKNTGILALEYRGYGANSSAVCSEYKLSKDVERAYKFLTKERGVKPQNITVIGHSMGGALAVDFAQKHKDLKSLILVAPITHTDSLNPKFWQHKKLGMGISEKLYSFGQKFTPLRWLTARNYNSLENIKNVETPVHIIHSNNDSVTSTKGARRFAAQARKQGILKDITILKSGGHKVDSAKVDLISEIIERNN